MVARAPGRKRCFVALDRLVIQVEDTRITAASTAIVPVGSHRWNRGSIVVGRWIRHPLVQSCRLLSKGWLIASIGSQLDQRAPYDIGFAGDAGSEGSGMNS